MVDVPLALALLGWPAEKPQMDPHADAARPVTMVTASTVNQLSLVMINLALKVRLFFF